jgi:alpha-galactosidase
MSVEPDGLPLITSLRVAAQPEVDWAAPAYPLAPTLIVGGVRYAADAGNLHYERVEVADPEGSELLLLYRLENGLAATLHLRSLRERAVLESWVTLHNLTDAPVAGITRFDALALHLGVSAADPEVSYLLGWLYGPRADAPGHHTVPFAYPSWIPDLLYGAGPRPRLFTPEAGWYSPLLRPIIGERLTTLPLRSGKRSTFDNFPWALVHDPERAAGFFVGFTWSGTWALDIEHLPEAHAVSVAAYTNACEHTLAPGAKLSSPRAYVGFFQGDWEDAANASRSYLCAEVLRPLPAGLPTVTAGIGPSGPGAYEGDRLLWREEVDACAEAGVECFGIDAGWWAERYTNNDFSYGLGCFEGNRSQYRDGLRAASDYVHAKGMQFGLWFEVERVDLRTANRGRRPWRPEWLAHQGGYPHRSWCQHVYSLCLGEPAAQEWAVDNLAWAVREYNIDEVLIDSNEWAVCDDPLHAHGPQDGEWAQTQGLYAVLEALRREFPNKLFTNLGGGTQRGDPGVCRHFQRICPADVIVPAQVNRKYSYGLGHFYPAGLIGDCVAEFPGDAPGQLPADATFHIPAEELEWRCLNAVGGALSVLIRLRNLDAEGRAVVARVVAFYKRMRRALWGDRYVLAAPQPFVELHNRLVGHREASIWEATEHLALERDLIALLIYRCNSPEPERTFRLRGLEAGATYRVESYSGDYAGVRTGTALMEQGIRVSLEHMRQADVVLFTREQHGQN